MPRPGPERGCQDRRDGPLRPSDGLPIAAARSSVANGFARIAVPGSR